MTEPRPISPPDATTTPWWEATKERRFLLQRCTACGQHQHYPRSICTSCHARDLTWVDASGRGAIYSFSEVHRAPHPAFEAPYVVALIRLAEGPVVMGNIIGSGEVACDAAVELDWEPLPDGRMLPQFRLA